MPQASINTNFQLASWRDGNGGFFVLSAATTNTPPSETQPLSGRGEIRKVHDAGGVSAVWRVGEAFVKLKETISSHATKEHTTLEYLRDRQPLNFHIPDVHYHADLGNRYLIVLGGLAGRTLNDAWDEMDDTTRQECVSRIASICMELTTWEGDIIGGVDGKQLTNQYLLKSSAEMNFNPCNLLKNCKEMGMDCSSLVRPGTGEYPHRRRRRVHRYHRLGNSRVCSEGVGSYQVPLLERVGLVREGWGEYSAYGLETSCVPGAGETGIF